jgi:hypothetical protein
LEEIHLKADATGDFFTRPQITEVSIRPKAKDGSKNGTAPDNQPGPGLLDATII